MDKILERLGIYDLVAVLLSGMCMVVFSVFLTKFIWNMDLSSILNLDETIYFLVISYFIGIVFQELGSNIQHIIFSKNELLEDVFHSDSKEYVTLAEDEKSAIREAAKEKFKLDKEPSVEMLYNACKFGIDTKELHARADKDQAIMAMSRSLSLYLFGASVLLILRFIICKNNITWPLIICLVLMLAVSVVMYRRFIRFTKMRYIYILRAFYYETKKEKETSVSDSK